MLLNTIACADLFPVVFVDGQALCGASLTVSCRKIITALLNQHKLILLL